MNHPSTNALSWVKAVQTKGTSLGLISVLLVSIGTLAGCGSEPNTEQVDSQPADVQPVEETTVTPDATKAEEPETTESEEVPAEVEIDEADTAEIPEEANVVETETEALSATAGKELYESNCKLCHEPGLLNAPKLGDKDAWAERVAKGIDTLHEHSAKGYKQMPAQAVNGISEAQVYAAVDYMVEQSS